MPSHYQVCDAHFATPGRVDLLSLLPARAAYTPEQSRTSAEGDVVSNIDQSGGTWW